MTRLMRLLTQCNGKVRHASRAAALAALEKSERAYQKRMHAYYCEVCKGWHVASSAGGRGR